VVGETQILLGRAVKEWCLFIDPTRQNNKNLNLRIFEATRDEFSGDVEITEPKKQKELKEDPRLAMMRQKKKSEAS